MREGGGTLSFPRGGNIEIREGGGTLSFAQGGNINTNAPVVSAFKKCSGRLKSSGQLEQGEGGTVKIATFENICRPYFTSNLEKSKSYVVKQSKGHA